MSHIFAKSAFFLLFVIVLVALTVPLYPSFAQDQNPDPSQQGEQKGLVRCGRELASDGSLKNPCDFEDLVALAQILIEWLIYISVSVAAIMFTYAGYLYVTAAGSEEQVKKAHEIFRNVFIGFILVLAAWLIVYTISIAVVADPEKTILLDSGN